ncbi:MAG: hypothetical protein IPM97_00210 [Bdellovibrionaceae bacterium]|nr:hypothetical protein [Pseudobdellovibrionaceae bacterium]
MTEWQTTLGIFLISVTAGCTSAQIDNYNYKINHALDWTENPRNQEGIKYWYFNTIGLNPYRFIDLSEPSCWVQTNLFSPVGTESTGLYLIRPLNQNGILGTPKFEDYGDTVNRSPAQSTITNP